MIADNNDDLMIVLWCQTVYHMLYFKFEFRIRPHEITASNSFVFIDETWR